MDARRHSKQKFNHARNLTEPGWQEAVSDERIFNSITNGRKKMPAFGKKITQAEIDSLVLLVRGMQFLVTQAVSLRVWITNGITRRP